MLQAVVSTIPELQITMSSCPFHLTLVLLCRAVVHFSPFGCNIKKEPPPYNFNGFVAASPAQSFLFKLSFYRSSKSWFLLRDGASTFQEF
jgi:hypothetical protein